MPPDDPIATTCQDRLSTSHDRYNDATVFLTVYTRLFTPLLTRDKRLRSDSTYCANVERMTNAPK